MDTFSLLVLGVSFAAGAVAAVSGFGIGSLITPLLVLQLDSKLAVAAVSIPHLIATATRLWLMKTHVDRKVLLSFGLASAAGGLTGALFHGWVSSTALTAIFGGILIFSGLMGVTEWSQKLRFDGPLAWWAGVFSGFMGGMVGNQGGIRSAALMGFPISKDAFIATATATGLIVDLVRMPFYVWNEGIGLYGIADIILIATAGALVGTLLGKRILSLIPEKMFRKVVNALILLLGLSMVLVAAK